MKKLIALTLSSAIVLSFSLSAMATVTSTYDEATLTVTTTITADENLGDQATLLVYPGAVLNVANGTNIEYIDQEQAGQDADGSTVFSYKLKSGVVANQAYSIYVGGSNKTAPLGGAGTVLFTQATGPAVTAENIATVVNVNAATDVFGVVGDSYVTVNIASLVTLPDVTSDYKITVKGTEFRYNAANGKFVGTVALGGVALVPADISIAKVARTTNDVMFGDLNYDTVINTLDLNDLLIKLSNASYVFETDK